MKKIGDRNFFKTDATTLAQNLIGKHLCIKNGNEIFKAQILETESYLGEIDSASHCFKGKTPRNSVCYEDGGKLYVYLCYGLHSLINVVASEKDVPECVLLRGVRGALGPGKLTKLLGIDRSFNGLDIIDSDRIWVEDDGKVYDFLATTRVGIDYALNEDREAKLRFILKE